MKLNIFTDLDLCIGLIKMQSGTTSGPDICLVPSYGSPTKGPQNTHRESPPVHSGRKQRVFLTVPVDSIHPQLLYISGELTGITQHPCSGSNHPITLTSDATGYLLQVSNGHPALVQALVRISIQ